MFELFLSAFVSLFVVIDPPGCAPIFYGLTTGATPAQRRSMAVRAVLTATAILLVFAAFGEPLLAMLGIGNWAGAETNPETPRELVALTRAVLAK